MTYSYDPNGQLLSSADSSDATCTSFAYDAAGNRTQYKSTVAGAPVANHDAVSTNENVAITFDPRLNDTSPSCYPLTITSVASPPHGSVTYSTTSVTYTPTNNYVGSDGPFNYGISDGNGGTATGTITVTVAAALTVSISPGVAASGPSSSETYASNTCVVSGGSGSFTYLWAPAGGGVGGTWTTGGTAATFTPAVSGVPAGGFSSANYTCTVTDTVYHINTQSSGSTYRWRNTTPPP